MKNLFQQLMIFSICLKHPIPSAIACVGVIAIIVGIIGVAELTKNNETYETNVRNRDTGEQILFVVQVKRERERGGERGRKREREVDTETGRKFLYKKLYYLMINKINVFI